MLKISYIIILISIFTNSLTMEYELTSNLKKRKFEVSEDKTLDTLPNEILLNIIFYTTNFWDIPNVYKNLIKVNRTFRRFLSDKKLDRIAKQIYCAKKEIKPNLSYNINFQNEHGKTALIFAAQNNYFTLTKFLLEKKANLKLQTIFGTNALMAAATKNYVNIMEILLNNGASAKAKGPYNLTALKLAAQNNSMEAAKLLIQVDADINIQDFRGQTPLMLAADGKHLELMELLINSKADMSIKDIHGNTILISAFKQNNIEAVNILLKYGAK